MKYGNAFGRGFNALFDPAVNEAVGGASQRAFAQHGRPALEAAKATSKDETYRVIHGIDAGIKAGLSEADVLRASRQMAEGVAARGAAPGVVAAAQPVADIVRRGGDARLAEAKRLGIPLADLADSYVSHVPRAGVDIGSAQQVAAGKSPVRSQVQSGPGGNLPLTSSANIHRSAVYRDVPGGTAMLDDLAIRHAGDVFGLGVHGIRRDVLRRLAGELTAAGTPLTRPLVKQLGDKATVLARKLVKLDPAHSTHDIPLFSPNITQDVGRAGESHARSVANANAIYGLIGDHARPVGTLGGEAVPVSQVLKRIGLKTIAADKQAGKPAEGALVQALGSLGQAGGRSCRSAPDGLDAGPSEGRRSLRRLEGHRRRDPCRAFGVVSARSR